MASNTKQVIREAFMKLLNERPISKITVRDITDECGINRNSFYYHYQDIPSLLQDIVRIEAEEIIQRYPTIGSLEEALDTASAFAVANKRAVQHIFNSSNRDILEQYLMQASRQVVTIYIQTVFGHCEIYDYDREVLVQCYTCMLFGYVVEWINTGMSPELYNIFRRYCELKRGSSNELIMRMTNDFKRGVNPKENQV